MSAFDLIIAGASVRSLAESAVRDGWSPQCVDMFADRDLVRLVGADRSHRISDPWHVVSAIEAVGVRCPVILTGGLENNLPLLTALHENESLVGSQHSDAIAAVRDPKRLFDAISRANMPVPRWQTTPPNSGTQFVTKSTRSSGGLDVRLIAPRRTKPVPAHVYYQEFIDGITMSATFVRDDESTDARLLGMTLQLCGHSAVNATGFQFCGNFGPVTASTRLKDGIGTVGRVLVSELGLQGVFGVDFVLNEAGPWILEVNPRPTASHELLEWGHRHPKSHITQHVEALFPVCCPDNRSGRHYESGISSHWARLIIYSRERMEISVQASAKLMNHARDDIHAGMPSASVFLADIPAAGTIVEAGTPFCSLYINTNDSWRAPLREIITDTNLSCARDLDTHITQLQATIDTICDVF